MCTPCVWQGRRSEGELVDERVMFGLVMLDTRNGTAVPQSSFCIFHTWHVVSRHGIL